MTYCPIMRKLGNVVIQVGSSVVFGRLLWPVGILERLDRAKASYSWISHFPNSVVFRIRSFVDFFLTLEQCGDDEE